jgi:signal transduction histidine kinase
LSDLTRHDILNSITGLQGYLEFSEEIVGDNQKLAEYLKKEHMLTETIKHQIEFTKFYQNIGVKAADWQDVARTIRRAADQLTLESVSLTISFSELEIFADALIGKVFFNLIENSLRHGGEVTSVSFHLQEDESGLIIVYADNGSGIPEKDKTRIFSRGFGKHTGFGMFLSREILGITGISISENGTPGEGARFEIQVGKGKYRFNKQPEGMVPATPLS